MTHLENINIRGALQLYRRKEPSSEMLPDLGDTETLKKKNKREREKKLRCSTFTELIDYGEGYGRLKGIVFFLVLINVTNKIMT